MGFYLSLKGKVYVTRGSFWEDFNIFEILGEAGDINNSTSMPNYQDGPYHDLVKYVNTVLSAWTEVWTISCPSRASIMAPEGRDQGDFSDSGWAGDM